MSLHAILFSDLGALAETDALHAQAVNAALTEVDEPEIPSADFATLAETDIRDALRDRYGAGVADRAAELFRDRMAEIGLTPRPGVAEVLSAAQAQDVRMALISSLDRETMKTALEAFGSTLEPGHFTEIITREQGGTTSGGHRRTLDLLAAQPHDAISIAPSPGRSQAARDAQLPVLAFPSAAYREASFEGVSQTVAQLSIADLGLTQPA